MELTEKGEELFENMRPIIDNLLTIESKFLNNRDINFGTYNTMMSKMLSECINKYYQSNKKSKINLVNNKIEDMIMLLDSEIDILLSKRISEDLYDTKKIKYIKLGELSEVLITSNNSKIKDKIINITDLKEEIIYVPRNDSITILNFINKLEKEGLCNNIKRIDSATIIKMLENGDGVGIMTKEYIKEEIEMKKISILKTEFALGTSEIGIYIRKGHKFKELTEFIEILKERFEKI